MGRSRARPEDTYHHGHLRRAMVEQALRIVEEDGLEALTLREAARRAGVSHAAPAHHFGDLNGLLQASAAAGHQALRTALLAGASAARDGPGRLRAVGLAYVQFAEERGPLFGLMFHPSLGRRTWSAELQRSATATFEVLLDAIRAAQEEGAVRGAPARELALAAWSAVHGLAALATAGHAAHKGFRLPARRLGEIVTAALFEGLRAR